MEDSHRMAVLSSVDDLEEHLFDQGVVADILQVHQYGAPTGDEETTHPLSLGDHAEEITLIAEVHDDEDVVPLLKHLVQCDDIRMVRGKLVKGDLSPLEMSLSRVETGAEKAFDSKVHGFGSV